MKKYFFAYSVDITNDYGSYVNSEPIWEHKDLHKAIREAKVLGFAINEVCAVMTDEEGNIVKERNITKMFTK